MKGIVERTRIAVVEVASKDESAIDNTSTQQHSRLTTDEDTMMEDDDDSVDDMLIDEGQGNWEMEVARVYERTIVVLGESLDPSANGELS